ncbi:MAG TPA: YjjG family noncanonical pyrimidine nucleotidase [Ferruginibacter sp.]|nr:YjjG family noncanonical pyrimidine nucleotidase [Ferruginibacter sp.]HRO18043.1 YjjG family noncanonical pyrimidine nucleotidase [Ferruginibacter sp.]HRQ21176.1 YjjG family noncanonical pyrimidine nucleotidase [Ferruginibacter sp.]
MPSYQHLFFDLDHTLWDFDKNASIALKILFDEEGLNNKIQAPFEDFYRIYLHHNEVLWNRYHHGFISAEDLKWRRMWRTLLEFKVADEELSKTLGVKFLDILPIQKEVFPYTFEILRYLSDKGYVLHLITNGFQKTQRTKLMHSGLEPYFRHMITSECSNSVKPKKEIFEYALQKSGAALNESLMIGDNLDADIQGAINAGMDSVFVNHTQKPHSSLSTYTITHLKELEHIL